MLLEIFRNCVLTTNLLNYGPSILKLKLNRRMHFDLASEAPQVQVTEKGDKNTYAAMEVQCINVDVLFCGALQKNNGGNMLVLLFWQNQFFSNLVKDTSGRE